MLRAIHQWSWVQKLHSFYGLVLQTIEWALLEAYKVHATVWPVVSEPAMKKIANSSISLSLLRGLPLLSLSRSRCPAHIGHNPVSMPVAA